jgi:hypothetical protein
LHVNVSDREIEIQTRQVLWPAETKDGAIIINRFKKIDKRMKKTRFSPKQRMGGWGEIRVWKDQK